MKGSRILLKLLKNHGVKCITGIIGREAEALLFDNKENMDFILVRHEQTAGIASEVYARKNKNTQACISTIGPGVTNLATGVASAFKDSSPMIAIGMQVEREYRKENVHQYLDNVAIMKPITKYATEPNTIYELIDAFKVFPKYLYSEKPGPVFISVCIDILKEEYPDITEEDLKIEEYREEEKELDLKKIEEMFIAIQNSEKPVILAGKEALEHSEKIKEFATKYNIPIGTSLAGKGVISERDSLSIGTVTKYWDKLLKKGLLEESFKDIDLIILLGFDYSEDLTEGVWSYGKNKRILKIGKTNNIEQYFHIDVELVGDISKVLDSLCQKNVKKEKSGIPEKIKQIKEKNKQKKDETINVFKVLEEIRNRMGKEDNLISDVGLHKHITALYYDALYPNTFFCSNGLATMGFGLPAGIGTSMADKEHKSIVVCGDGSFHSVSQDFATCVKYEIPLIVVLFKDDAYGLIRLYQYKGNGKFDDESTCFSTVDFSMLAQANGGNGFSVKTVEEFVDKFEKALKSKKPTLIEIPVKYNII